MKQILILSLTILLLIGCNLSSKRKKENVKIKIGLNEEFILRGFNIGVQIYLKPDFTFINNCYSYSCAGGYRIKLVTGHYDIDSNQITFNPKKMVWKEALEYYNRNSKLKFDTIKYYESDSTSIQKKYWLVKENKLKFLVSESNYNDLDELFYKSSNFISLANLYNSNIKQYANKNMLSNIDTLWNFKSLNMQNIPEFFRALFLDTAIRAKVISSKVYKINESLIPKYILEIKEINRVRVGMNFYSKDYPYYPIKIIKINNEYCIGEGYDIFFENTKLKIGTIVSTERIAVYDNSFTQ